MSRALILKRPSTLAYPGGQPGFDPSRTESFGVKFSAVAAAGGFINLLNGKPGSLLSSPPATIDGNIGPGSIFASGSNASVTFSGMLASQDNALTIATVIRFSALSNFNTWFDTSVGGWGMAVSVLGTGINPGYNFWAGSGGSFNTINLSVGVPYLIIIGLSTLTSSQNCVVVNLLTGAILSEIKTATVAYGTGGTPSGIFEVGNNNGGGGAGATISAAMYSNTQMSIPQMLQWAQDPWSFWYP